MSQRTTDGLLGSLPDGTLVGGAAVFAAITGSVHLWLAIEEWGEPDEALPFLLAGLGFFVGIGFILFTERRRHLLYLLGAAFTAIEIPLWVLKGMEEFELGIFDKVIQLLLVAVLLYMWRDARSTAASG